VEEIVTKNMEMNNIKENGLDSKINELINHIYSVGEWIEKHSIISVDDKQLIQSYLDTYVAELEDFQKGQLEPMF
jgi:hypothetical protein